MPWFSPSAPRDTSKIDAVNKQKAETTIRKYKEKGETRYIVRSVGTGRGEIEQLCAVMNSIDDMLKKENTTTGEKVRSIKSNVDLALTIGFDENKNSPNYDQAKEIFDTMKQYFKRLDNAMRSSGELSLKLNYAKNVYEQFDDKYRNLFSD
ncbi:MAG: hypothetical protein AABX39_04605 [Nanoarchaeota archaeon]